MTKSMMTRMPFDRGRAHELDEVAEGPEAGIDAEEVGDVVAVVLAGGGVEGHQPQARHAEVGEVLDAVGHTADVAGAVAVPSRRRSRCRRSRRRRSSTTGHRCRARLMRSRLSAWVPSETAGGARVHRMRR